MSMILVADREAVAEVKRAAELEEAKEAEASKIEAPADDAEATAETAD